MSAEASALIEVYRNEVMESVHYGHIVVADSKGQIAAYLGQHDVVTYIRSTAKPLQAIPLIEWGAVERFGLTAQEIAVICASHNGEGEHRQAVQSILNKIGTSKDELRCGIHPAWLMRNDRELLYQQQPPTVLDNNCSGKHAGMLALARLLDVDSNDYDQPGHPVQQHMLHAVAEMAGVPAQAIQLGVDGCGVPVFSMPLYALATAYAKLGQPDKLPLRRQKACNTIIDALKQAPFYIAGSQRFDTELIRVTKGRIIGKMGAEGMYGLAIPEAGLGLAIKISDGARRAASSVVIEALRQLDALNAEELEQLKPFHHPLQHNHRGDQVGKLTPCFRLIDKSI